MSRRVSCSPGNRPGKSLLQFSLRCRLAHTLVSPVELPVKNGQSCLATPNFKFAGVNNGRSPIHDLYRNSVWRNIINLLKFVVANILYPKCTESMYPNHSSLPHSFS